MVPAPCREAIRKPADRPPCIKVANVWSGWWARKGASSSRRMGDLYLGRCWMGEGLDVADNWARSEVYRYFPFTIFAAGTDISTLVDWRKTEMRMEQIGAS